MASANNLSSYELARQRNIERNMAFLRNIGLETSIGTLVGIASPSPHEPVAKETKTRKRSTLDTTDSQIASELQDSSRRSTRIAAMKSVNYNVDNIHVFDTSATSASTGTALSRPRLEESDIGDHTSVNNLSRFIAPSSGSKPAASVDPQSTRSLSANLSLFLGSDNLCKPFSEFGKAAVVIASNNGSPPKFSKYSGVLEWKNCVFLWVNLGPDQSDDTGSVGGRGAELTYDNTFLSGGRSFVWFGGNKMTTDTPVIQRMLRIGAAAAAEAKSSKRNDKQAEKPTPSISPEDPEMILLFVRIVGEPYCCLGPLSLLNCNVDRHPLVFHWQLREYDTLVSGPHKEHFQRILRVSPMS